MRRRGELRPAAAIAKHREERARERERIRERKRS